MSETHIESYVAKRHKNMINKPLYSDIILVVGEDKKKIHAQKQLLAEFSPYYAAAFNEQWKQEKTGDQKQQILTHPDIDEDIILLILEYMYVGTVSDIGGENVSKVYRAADFLQLDHLMEICETKLNEENAFEMYEAAFEVEKLPLALACLEIVKPNLPFLAYSRLSKLSIEIITHTIINCRNISHLHLWDFLEAKGKSFSNQHELDDLLLKKIIEVLKDLKNRQFLFQFDPQQHSAILSSLLKAATQNPNSKKELEASFRTFLIKELVHRVTTVHISKIFDSPEKFFLVRRKLSEIINDSHNSSKRISWKLLFRASEHGFKGRKFHEFCDDKGATVTIVKANNRIAAAYNCDSWSGEATKDNFIYTMNKEGFIVSIEGEKFSKFWRKLQNESGALSYFNWCPCFGGELTDNETKRFDLKITDCCQELASGSWIRRRGCFPHTFVWKVWINFIVQEYEVFGIEME